MKSKKARLTVVILIIIAAAAVAVFVAAKQKAASTSADESSTTEVEYTVASGDISMSVSESGTVTPTDKRSIKSEIDGTVDTIYVTEGDVVEPDQVLISLKSDTDDDTSTEINSIQLSIEKLQRELNDLYENQGDLNIYAPISGIISNLDIEAGDNINSNSSIATIKDTDNSYINVYFSKEQFEKISIGDAASVFMTKYFSTHEGIVTEKDSTPVQMGGGTFGYLVTVQITNPGGFSVGDTAQVSVSNNQGTYQAMQNGEIDEVKEESIISKVSGEIKSVETENGKYVNKGDLIAVIEGTDLEFEISEKQNSIKKYKSQIEDMLEGDTIYSPMTGTILNISVSEDEVVDRSTALMTIADMEDMKVVIAVDELDINKIAVGQKANISSDTYPDEEFTGTVTKISLEGTTSNGVTTYDVTVNLDDRKSLMSGMNVDVEIVSEISEDTLIIPVEAVHRQKNNYIVTIKDSSGNTSDVVVEMGIATDDQVEILSGLNEGDTIVYTVVKSNNATTNTMNMGMPGITGGVQGGPAGGPGGQDGGPRP